MIDSLYLNGNKTKNVITFNQATFKIAIIYYLIAI